MTGNVAALGILFSTFLFHIMLVKCEEDVCKLPRMDVLFIIDGTREVGAGNHMREKEFIMDFVKRMTIGVGDL